jgi:hypothetical protein
MIYICTDGPVLLGRRGGSRSIGHLRTRSASMPLLQLSEEQTRAALEAGQSDLKWLLADQEVPLPVQSALFHLGFTKMRVFAGLGETRIEVKEALKKDFGLDGADDLQSRQSVALVLAAWEASKEYVARDAAKRAEAHSSRLPRALSPVEHLAMRDAFEAKFGHLRDSEVPSPYFLGRKTEEVENNEPKPERLAEVTSREDNEEDFMTAEINEMGLVKVRRGAKPRGIRRIYVPSTS